MIKMRVRMAALTILYALFWLGSAILGVGIAQAATGEPAMQVLGVFGSGAALMTPQTVLTGLHWAQERRARHCMACKARDGLQRSSTGTWLCADIDTCLQRADNRRTRERA